MTKMLFCRIGWMPWYRGELDSQGKVNIHGGGSFVHKHGYGHEMYNFLSDDQGNLYGVVEVGDEKSMSIERLGARPKAANVSPVLVIWVATHPREGGMRIVGWYKNATVFRRRQPCPQHLIGQRRLPDPNDQWGFRIIAKIAKKEDAVLLAEDERIFVIRQARGGSSGMGQKNIWYADAPRDQQLCQGVLEYIRSYKGKILAL